VLVKAHHSFGDSSFSDSGIAGGKAASGVTFGAEAGGDWISSNNLGDHSYVRASAFGELEWNLSRNVTLYPGLRLDHYSNFGSTVSPSLSVSWRTSTRLRLRASAGRAFRIPTFLELYYRDPNHQAEAGLRPEKAWAAEAGAEFVPAKDWIASVTFFSRWESDVIDWIRSSEAEKWHNANIQDVHAAGVEIGLERSLGERAGVAAHYSYISTDAGAVDYLSKYALDYAKHSWSSSTHFPLFFGLKYRQTFGYKKRSDGRDYWLWDNALERPLHRLVAEVSFSNLLDSRYQEVWGVDMPGRWFAFRLRTR
jgi:iron complex outermembrane receptor protein